MYEYKAQCIIIFDAKRGNRNVHKQCEIVLKERNDIKALSILYEGVDEVVELKYRKCTGLKEASSTLTWTQWQDLDIG